MDGATPRTRRLFLHVVALLRRSTSGMTVAELAQAVDLPNEFVAECIALHIHLERVSRLGDVVPVALPNGSWVPASDERLTYPILAPPEMRSDETLLEINAARDAA